MTAVVECGCGQVLEAEDEESLYAEINSHVEDLHPELLGTLSPLELAGQDTAEQAAA